MTAASRWYEAQRVGLGEEFMAAIDTALRLIESNPAVGSRPPGVKDEDVRRVLVRRFPYDVVYMELPDRIQVLAIAHERRRPGLLCGSHPKIRAFHGPAAHAPANRARGALRSARAP